MNIKVKLETDIATYHHLLEQGENLSLGNTRDSSNSEIHPETTTHRTPNSKVVPEVNNTKVLRC